MTTQSVHAGAPPLTPAPRPAPAPRRRRRPGRLAVDLAVAGFALLWLVPVYWMEIGRAHV